MPEDEQSEMEKLAGKVNKVAESDFWGLPSRILEFGLKGCGGCFVVCIVAVIAAMILGTLYGGLSHAIGNVPAFLILVILIVIVILAATSKPHRRG